MGVCNNHWNGVNFDAGTVGRAFSLTGGAHIRVPDSASLDFSNAITIEGWIFPTDASAYHDIVSKWDMVGANQRSFAVGILPDGTFGFTLAPYGTTASTSLLQSTNHIPVNQWTHFAGTYVIDGKS